MNLAVFWILYAVVGIILFSAVFFWAARAGQFRDQDRARYLPLHCPENNANCTASKVEEEDS